MMKHTLYRKKLYICTQSVRKSKLSATLLNRRPHSGRWAWLFTGAKVTLSPDIDKYLCRNLCYFFPLRGTTLFWGQVPHTPFYPYQGAVFWQGKPCLLFEKKQKDMFISLAQRNWTKETSTSSKASPYMGRMQLITGYPPFIKVFVWLSSLCPE